MSVFFDKEISSSRGDIRVTWVKTSTLLGTAASEVFFRIKSIFFGIL